MNDIIDSKANERALALKYLAAWSKHPTWNDEKLCAKLAISPEELNLARNSEFVHRIKKEWLEQSEIAVRRALVDQTKDVTDILLKIIKSHTRNPMAAVQAISVWGKFFQMLLEKDMVETTPRGTGLGKVLPGGIRLTNINVTIGQAPTNDELDQIKKEALEEYERRQNKNTVDAESVKVLK